MESIGMIQPQLYIALLAEGIKSEDWHLHYTDHWSVCVKVSFSFKFIPKCVNHIIGRTIALTKKEQCWHNELFIYFSVSGHFVSKELS
jgi:hypothetical protein